MFRLQNLLGESLRSATSNQRIDCKGRKSGALPNGLIELANRISSWPRYRERDRGGGGGVSGGGFLPNDRAFGGAGHLDRHLGAFNDEVKLATTEGIEPVGPFEVSSNTASEDGTWGYN